MKSIRQTLRVIAAAAVLATLATTATTASAQDITVVSIQAVTGAGAFLGVNYQKSIRMAVDEFNEKGGVSGQKIKLIEQDNASDKGQAVNLVNQAIDRDRAVLVLGPSLSTDGIAVAPIFNEKKTPFLTFATADAVTKAGPWTLKYQQSPSEVSPLVANYLLKKTSVKKVALVFDRGNEGLIDFKNHFRDSFKANGGSIVAEEAVVGSDSNFLPLGTKLKSMDLDAVFISTLAEQSANIILQLRQAGLSDKIRYVGHIAMVTPKFVSMTGAIGEGTIAVSDYVQGVDRPLNKAFEAAYKARWGVEPDSWAASAYSLAQVSFAILKEAGPNPTREKVMQAYSKIRDVPVVGGTGVWNQKDRSPKYGAIVLQVKDGKFVAAP